MSDIIDKKISYNKNLSGNGDYDRVTNTIQAGSRTLHTHGGLSIVQFSDDLRIQFNGSGRGDFQFTNGGALWSYCKINRSELAKDFIAAHNEKDGNGEYTKLKDERLEHFGLKYKGFIDISDYKTLERFRDLDNIKEIPIYEDLPENLKYDLEDDYSLRRHLPLKEHGQYPIQYCIDENKTIYDHLDDYIRKEYHFSTRSGYLSFLKENLAISNDKTVYAIRLNSAGFIDDSFISPTFGSGGITVNEAFNFVAGKMTDGTDFEWIKDTTLGSENISFKLLTGAGTTLSNYDLSTTVDTKISNQAALHYLKTSFVSTATSPTEDQAGFPVKLNTSGLIDSSLVDYTVYTDEEAQDAALQNVIETTTINPTYNAVNNTLALTVKTGNINHNSLNGLTIDDPHTQYILGNNNAIYAQTISTVVAIGDFIETGDSVKNILEKLNSIPTIGMIDTTNFDNNLNDTMSTVQLCLDAIDDLDLKTSSGTSTTLDTSNFDNNLSSSDDTVQKALDTLDNISIKDVTLDTTNFDKYLSSSDNTIQKAFDKLDDLSLDSSDVRNSSLDTANFNNNLSSSDNTIQKAFDKLDDLDCSTDFNGVLDYVLPEDSICGQTTGDTLGDALRQGSCNDTQYNDWLETIANKTSTFSNSQTCLGVSEFTIDSVNGGDDTIHSGSYGSFTEYKKISPQDQIVKFTIPKRVEFLSTTYKYQRVNVQVYASSVTGKDIGYEIRAKHLVNENELTWAFFGELCLSNHDVDYKYFEDSSNNPVILRAFDDSKISSDLFIEITFESFTTSGATSSEDYLNSDVSLLQLCYWFDYSNDGVSWE